jgi:pyridinium-3,5-biscarboxylic acid mononucleotide sulfurtransferase
MINSEKYESLLSWFLKLDNAAIAFSGGVDSTFVLASAHKVLGGKVLAYTVKTPYIPDREINDAIAYCTENNIRHKVIHATIIPDILRNPMNRCYLCKKYLFSMLKDEARKDGFFNLLDGTNHDDETAHRPGFAALKELGIKSPLLENGISKAEVRSFSASLGLPTADKPSYACLLTRIPYNTELKSHVLNRVEKAEDYLISIGYGASRVRDHGNIARIEIEKERISEFISSVSLDQLTSRFHKLGYEYVTIDLEGYRSGSFDKK